MTCPPPGMGLRTYRRKRDFARTPEPRGGTARPTGGSFVIQKHAARRLHHDFRLEHGGVLLSWAVPAGPPTRPGSRSLAVRTEDHPIEYGDFEGVIPEGEYGGGTVMLWDRGRWEPEGSVRAGIRAGKLHFRLDGERLRGRWSLVRMAPRPRESAENWLLIKRSDDGRGARAAPPALDRSVATGRTMAQIARDADRTWSSRDGETRRQPARRSPARAGNGPAGARRRTRPRAADAIDPATLPGARPRTQPRSLRPQLATLASAAPAGDDWLHEVKFDGYRVLAFLKDGEVRLLTRTGQDWSDRFPTVAAAVAALPVSDAIVDGEIVVLRADGRSDFQALQNSMDAGDTRTIVLFAFDLPHCAGHDLTRTPLLARKELLARLLAGTDPGGPLRYSDHVLGSGPTFFLRACEMALEGAISKRVDAPYEARRTRTWVKTKCLRRQEFVVGGYTDPAGSRRHFGALLLGVHEDGDLRYAGKVGTGFTGRSLAELGARLRRQRATSPPFVDPPRARGVHWVRPECVVEVAFTEWTGDGLLRHPAFQGVREDKAPGEVRREQPAMPPGTATPAAGSSSGDRTVAGVRLSNPDRVLYPAQRLTKLDLARYYEKVAEAILPHVVDRPLTLVRCPRGAGARCFYQKHVTETLPAPVRSIRVVERDGPADYVGIDDLAGLVTLVQFGVLEVHPWGCRRDRLDQPDRVVIDLDPGPGVPWARVVQAARELHAMLESLGLVAFARTTGGKGLHVVLPIERRTTWPEVKAFARDLATALARSDPGAFVLIASKARRQERIYLDYLRNDRGATAIASWSTRAREGAPVAMPLGWSEVTARLDPAAYTVATAARRLRSDPWAGFFEVRQALTSKVREGLRRL